MSSAIKLQLTFEAMKHRDCVLANVSTDTTLASGLNCCLTNETAMFYDRLLAGVIFYSFIIGTSKIIGTFDFKALPATIACLNFNVGKILAIPSPK